MANNARTVTDLERKYNFSALLGMTENVKINEKSIIRVENELANMLNTLIINLKDVLDNQSEISLWFFSGIPTQTNEPYSKWTDASEHYGDIYYDQDSGYVYQCFENGWERNEDLNLIQAMALTNVELDTLTDHERKVYFTQPTPPYSSGDWWILEDGTLKICQLGKDNGDYEKDDFIVSSKYVATIATKTDDTITVLKGTVTKINENYVSVEDLATGGKTVINGANITTGQIDTNYVVVGNGNVQMNADGIQLKNGAKVVGEYGLMNTYLFENPNGFDTCGYEAVDTEPSTEVKIKGIKIIFNLPEKFNIVSAKVILHHAPTFWEWIIGTPGCTWGYCRNLKLYRATNINSKKYQAGYFSEYYETDSASYEEIAGAFGQDGWTPTEPTELKHDTEEETSIDIKDKVSNGLNELYIRVSEEKTGYVNPNFICERTAFVNAMVRVDGYMSYD